METKRKSTTAEQLATERIEKLTNTGSASKPIEDETAYEFSSHLPFKAFLFDAKFVPSRGVACLIKIMGGQNFDFTKMKHLTSYHTSKRYDIYEVGIVQPEMKKTDFLRQGQVGYFLSNMKSVSEANIGDTFFDDSVAKKEIEAFPGYETPQSMVFSGIYPEDPDDYEELEKSLRKLALTDGSVEINYESSAALGSGFRCGFLGMLHLDVFRQRLVDEYEIVPIITQPSITYYAQNLHKEDRFKVDNPADLERPELVKRWFEPISTCNIITPIDYVKNVKSLCHDRRGLLDHEEYLNDGKVVSMQYSLPLAEIVIDFFDRLKSVSQGYASLDYEHKEYQEADIKMVCFHLNGEPVDALTFLVHEQRAISFSKGYASRLKELLPSQLFKIAIQAKVGGKVIAREDVKAQRKDVTAKCYGGDMTRKRKLLEKQKKGKKKMRMLGSVPVDSSLFLGLLKK